MMATPIHLASPPNDISHRAFAVQNARPQTAFKGCSRITDYTIEAKLGEGTFGEVHRATSKKSGQVVALKKILMHNEKDGFPITALREIKLLKLLSHPNILKLEEMAVEHHSKSTDKRKRAIMYMVTPYMDHDLSGLLENPNVTFTEPQIKCYMLQLLEGLRYLHDNSILHRDMKAANLLINNNGILQIADFGLARHYDEPVPLVGRGGGEARRDYTTLVVTRWYRPPELLLHLRKYTTAIDLWGVGCVFGEMLIGRPILAGESDAHQLQIIFELVGTPTDESMPGWRSLPGAEGLNFPSKPSTLAQRFREYGSGAISLMKELLKLDWRKRTNAIDALKHPYFRNEPLPAKPEDLPHFEESHELDRRKFRGQKAAPPPAPKGGTVGMGPQAGWGGEPSTHGNLSYGNGEHYHGYRQHVDRRQGPGPYSNGAPPPPREERKPAWQRREDRPDARHPLPRPPPGDYSYDGGRSDRQDGYRSRSRELERGDRDRNAPRSRVGAPTVDTYIPSYNADGARSHDRPSREREDRIRDDRPPRDRDPRERDDRRRRDDRDDRRHDRDRDRLDYDERSRSGRTHSRSRSPLRERERERDRDRDREVYRR